MCKDKDIEVLVCAAYMFSQSVLQFVFDFVSKFVM